MKQPLQNRVLPTGEIAAIPQRGLLMGNRGGRLHDPQTKKLTRKSHVSRRWICCTLEFRNRQRTVMGDGYTELFFLDEVTALAAGHRPCFECRRADALAYQAAFSAGNRLQETAGADQMDKLLHADRLKGQSQKWARLKAGTLPEAVMAMINGRPHARHARGWLLWTETGYELPFSDQLPSGNEEIDVLTPLATVQALSAGFSPIWHPSAALGFQNP